MVQRHSDPVASRRAFENLVLESGVGAKGIELSLGEPVNPKLSKIGIVCESQPFSIPKPPQPLLAKSLSFLGLEVKSGLARSISLRECIEVANTSIAEWTHSAAMVVITPLSNPIATLQHLHLFSTTTTTTQWPPTIAMQYILAI